MRILVVNDDGIFAKGIYHLTRAAAKLGEVTVAAPRTQCSAMSHQITFGRKFLVRKESILEGIPAYSIDGTPADCVKIAVNHLMPEKPDLILSGINDGYNTGIDILYSGTVAAAMEGLIQGIPSMAFSIGRKGDPAQMEALIPDLIRDLLQKEIASNTIWNINFPPCTAEEVRGIRHDCPTGNETPYDDIHYEATPIDEDTFELEQRLRWTTVNESGTDLAAVRENYIAVGKIQNMILHAK